MTTLSWDRARRVAAAVSVLTVLAVVIAAVVLVLGAGVPRAWWPHTGQAFAADAARRDPCALIVDPATAYCERRPAAKTSAGHKDVGGGAWRLVPAGSGVAALVVWRLRAAGQRRH
ncbi:hypothetical protein [Streptomyces sp. NPDC047043]|uniref:hypothetical protein n=1 Tax=Streptomyces sp. NPDC047043 TaxID=3154497 RepID=UPI0033F6EE89